MAQPDWVALGPGSDSGEGYLLSPLGSPPADKEPLVRHALRGPRCCVAWHYEDIKHTATSGEFDPFGDFDPIFGAAKLNLKIVEIPVRYGARTYGTTQISRFRHGLLLLRMVIVASS